MVKVYQIGVTTADSKREFPFISKPNKIAELSFQVGGKLTVLDCRAGKFFRKGEVIAAIDSRDYKVAAMRAKAIYNQAKAEYNRIETLYKKDNISASTYEKVKADLAIAKAAFETAENQLVDTRLIAPFDGYIQTVSAERYQEVRPMQPIVTLIDMSKLKLEASIPEDVAASSSSIGRITARFDAAPNKEYTIVSVEVSKSTMSNNISFLLTAILNTTKGNNELLGGMTGTLFFELQSPVRSKVIAIPQRALCNRPSKGTYVWVVDRSGKVHSASVATGKLMSNDKVEITSGLKGNETIAITGLTTLSDSKQVAISK